MRSLFCNSFSALKRPKALAQTAMLTALGVVLSAYATIRITADFQVSFGYLASGMIAALFGPWVNAIAGVVTDLISYFLYVDGPYFFWFALNPVVSGIIFSLFFYQKEVTLPKALAAKLIDTIFVEIGLTSLWLVLLYGNSGWPWFAMRAVWKLVACCIQAPVLYLVLNTMKKIKLIG